MDAYPRHVAGACRESRQRHPSTKVKIPMSLSKDTRSKTIALMSCSRHSAVRHSARREAAVVGDGLPENGGIDQRLPPDRKSDRWPLFEEREHVLVCNEPDSGLADGAYRVIHFFEKERLRIGQVAGDVKGQVLPLS